MTQSGPNALATPCAFSDIPWHCHSESTDHYFVLRGTLSISTRDPNDERMLEMGGRYKITAGTLHLIANCGETDCLFLLLQGVGKLRSSKAKVNSRQAC
jgi:mannose-6-phosphate isomerase-like protein (cupin superfamily)